MKASLLLLLFILSSAGASAQLSFTSLNTSSTENLLGISFADSATGYACGFNGTILKTSNGGTSWTKLASGTTNKLWDIKVIPGSAGQKVIATGDNNTVIKSTNGGSTWTAQNIPFQSGSFVFGIHCIDSINYFACGGDYATVSGAILKTTNGGSTWTGTPVSGSVFLDKLFMINGTTGFTVGTNTSFSDGSIHKTTTGTSFPSVKTSGSIITNLWCFNASKIVAVGIGGQIWKSTDGGTNWTAKDFNTTDLYGICFRDAKRGYACGGGATSIILSTNDSGNTWSQETYSGTGTLQSMCIAGNKLFVAGDGGTILRATLPSTTGISPQPLPDVSINIYPNPVQDKFTVACSKLLQGLSIRICDINGRVVLAQMLSGTITEISTKQLAGGNYRYLIVRDGMPVQEGKLTISSN